jgi:hypothetical protein
VAGEPGPGIAGMWQVAHPIEVNSAAPGKVRTSGGGAGGSMVLRNATREVSGTPSASGEVMFAPQPSM